MGSESDLEIVHNNGTVTSKMDGVTRPYDQHVALVSAAALAPVVRPARRRVAALVGVLGFSAGALAVAATHVRL